MKTCPDCNGDGVVEKGTDDERQCPTCGGSGFVRDDGDGYEEVIKTSIKQLREYVSVADMKIEIKTSDVLQFRLVAPMYQLPRPAQRRLLSHIMC